MAARHCRPDPPDRQGRALTPALVVPGGVGGPYTPLLMFGGDAAEARGADVTRFSWTSPGDPRDLDPRRRGRWVCDQVAPVIAALDVASGRPLIVAKSLGTYAAPLAADQSCPAVWLTPVLDDSWVVEGLRRATAPLLLVGGTADPMWDGPLARELSPHVLEVVDANHGMYVPGPLRRSVEVLGDVLAAVEGFLDQVVWPAGSPNRG